MKAHGSLWKAYPPCQIEIVESSHSQVHEVLTMQKCSFVGSRGCSSNCRLPFPCSVLIAFLEVVLFCSLTNEKSFSRLEKRPLSKFLFCRL